MTRLFGSGMWNVFCIQVTRRSHHSPGTPNRTSNRIDREGWKALAIGLGIAVVVCLIPLLLYIIDFLRVVIHETGHTLAAWLFGYPAIPVLRPGGAVSALLSRQPLIVLFVLAVLGKLVLPRLPAPNATG
jgi:hypothetical protein